MVEILTTLPEYRMDTGLQIIFHWIGIRNHYQGHDLISQEPLILGRIDVLLSTQATSNDGVATEPGGTVDPYHLLNAVSIPFSDQLLEEDCEVNHIDVLFSLGIQQVLPAEWAGSDQAIRTG